MEPPKAILREIGPFIEGEIFFSIELPFTELVHSKYYFAWEKEEKVMPNVISETAWE